MFQYALPLLLGTILSLALTPLSRRLAVRIGAVDTPGDRRIHTIATPRFGGPAILAALGFALLSGALLDRSMGATLWPHWHRLGLLALGALMVTAVGAIDDVHALRPGTKLLVEIGAASIAVYGGYRIDALAAHHLGLVSFPLSVFFLVVVVNSLNLVDGLDGLAVGLCLIIGATLLFMCRSSHNLEGALVLAGLCGALLGFLPYNFNPARIFLGDSGALLLGFMLGAGAIGTANNATGTAGSIAPFLALGLPLAELILTTTRRAMLAVRVVRRDQKEPCYRFRFSGRPALFRADRDHIHHRLLNAGISHRSAALLLYGVCAVICTAAFAMATRAEFRAAPTLAAIAVASVAGARWLGYGELMPLRAGLLLPLFGSRAVGRTLFQVMIDVIAITSSYALALLIQWSAKSAPGDLPLATLPLIAVVQMATFALSGLYRRSWRHAGIDDAVAVIKAVTLAVGAETMVAMLWPSAHIGLPVVILDTYLLATMVLGSRLSFRVLDHLFERERADPRRVLIYGAGRAGAVALNEIRSNHALGMKAIGFLDDDWRKCGVKMQGVIIYDLASAVDLIRAGALDLVVLASAKIQPARAQILAVQCQAERLEIVRFEMDWQTAASDGATKIVTPRRPAAVIPIRSAVPD